jgi:uncharacterized protein (DUF362 family)
MNEVQRPSVYVDAINERNLLQKIKCGLDFVGAEKIINKKSVIFIKPNLTDVVHKPGITTTPTMIKAVIEIFSPIVKKVYVGESDGGNYSFSADNSLKNHGVFEVAKKFSNVEIVNLSKLPRTKVSENVCGKDVWVDLPDILINEIDCLVSVPVLKTHAMTYGTFSIKNLWGCYPDQMRVLHHKDLDYKLALINKLAKNKIQIVDGFWALDGHGPMEGTPVAVNKILISNDPVAVDASAAYIMHLDKNKIGHMRIAEKYGLGTSKIETIRYNKDISKEKLSKFKPYKVSLDYLSVLLFNNEFMAKLVLDSPLTPLIYRIINLTRPKEKWTYWAGHNKEHKYGRGD